nr:hypothetical protein [Tanacetum cinerariifolium]
MHVANTTAETHCLALEAELANLRETNNHDNQKELINHFSKLEVSHLNLQLKYQNLKDKIGNNLPTPDKDASDFDSVFVIGKMQASLQGKENVSRQLKKKLSQLAENDKIKQQYKELYDFIKITRAKHIKQVANLKNENMNLKNCVSKATVNPQVSARDKHAIDVEPIIPRLRNNRDAHLDYLRHLKESVETIYDIVEEAKVVRPLDRSIVSACRVNSCPNASESPPKSHVKPNRISPAKGDNKLPVDDQPRKNKSHLRTSNCIDSSSRLKRILDEQWFDLTKETLREALQITSVNHNQAFAAPPSIDGLIDFVNQLGYPKLVMNLSNRKHRFHPRPDSAFHLANDEPVLGYLKFSAKGTKREVFGMPIPGRLITADIREASNYQEYQENVAKHRGLLAGETGSTQDLPVPKPAKQARKPQSSTQKAPLKPSISSPVTSTQPAPTSTPAKSQGNKRKQATETTDNPAKAKRIKRSISRKTRQPRSSPKSVGASEAEEVPAEEPQVTDEDADYQKAVEESMKDAYALPKGPLPPVVIREPESRKYQPLLEVPGKGKAKVTEEHSDDEEESEKVVLEAKEGGQDEGQAGPNSDAQAKDQTGLDAGAQAKGQAGSNPNETSEGQARSNLDETFKGKARPDPSDAEAKVQSISSLMVYAGSDREHMDLNVANVSPQPSTEQLDEGFTATVYLNVQENLKLAVEEPVLLEEPASSSRTLSSLQHLSKNFSFGDQFFSDKLLDANKNAETEVKSMVNVTIQQALSLISLMTSLIIDLTLRPEFPKEHQQLKATTTDTTTTITLPPPQALQQSTTEAMMVKCIGELEHILADLVQVNKNMEERLDKHGARLYTLEQLDIPQQVSIAVSEVVTDAVDWAMQAPLCNRFRDLPEADMKEIFHQRMWESDSYKSHEDHMQLFEALEKSMNRDHSKELTQDLAKARKQKKKRRESPKTPPGSPSHQPPPPPPPAGPSGALGAPRASGSAQMPPSPPPPSSTNQESPSKGSAAPSPSKQMPQLNIKPGRRLA